MTRALRIGMVAGEASGDLLGASLIAALRKRAADIEIVGIGGEKMCAAGMRSLYPMAKLAVRGYLEVLAHLPELFWIRHRLKRHFLSSRPDVFVGIDAPDFNLGLERRLRHSGIATAHYVSPSVWAWRMERLKKIADSVSHMLLVFPFEEKIYADAGIPASYVGHPLADAIPLCSDKDAARQELGLPREGSVIALLPGSRLSELEYMTVPFLGAAEILAREFPAAVFTLPLANREARDAWQRHYAQRVPRAIDLRVFDGAAQTIMTAADVVLLASGTATLEAALLKRPMVISYRVSRPTYRLMWRQRRLPYIGLPNILAQKFIVPELLQDAATPERLAAAVAEILAAPDAMRNLEEEFNRMHLALRQGSAEKAADVILSIARRTHG